MADTKITILGMTGSGKTCYLYGLYYKMAAGMRGYSLKADDDQDVMLRKRYERLLDTSLSKDDRFPLPSDQSISYTFELQYGFKPIMSFDWIDYPGGMLKTKHDTENAQEYEYLKEEISESSSLFIVVDGELLANDDDNDEKADAIKDTCSSVINTFLSEYRQSNGKLPPTAIVITKFDKCKENLCEGESDDPDENIDKNLEEIMQEAFSPLFVGDEDNSNPVAIIPVSLGKGIDKQETTGKLKPFNIHLPIFMAILFSLGDKIYQLEKKIEQSNQKTDKRIRELNKEIDEENSKWRIFRNGSKISENIARIYTEEQKGKEELKEMKKLIEIVERDKDRLLKELKKINLLYRYGMDADWESVL